MTSTKALVEVAVIVAAIAVIWGLMSLPVVFYYLPQQSDSSLRNTDSGYGEQCTPTNYSYKGEVCKDTLLVLKQCIFNQTPGNGEDVRINISAVIDSQILKQFTTLGEQYLQTLAPSQECVAVLVPFLCQYLFTPCDERGVAYHPSSEDCVYIRDQVCAREWEEITRIPIVADYLPNCESLPNDTQCNLDLIPTAANGSTDSTNVSSPLMCSEGFVYIEEVHQCRPHCPSWEEYEHGFSIAYNVLIATSAAVSVSTSIVTLLFFCKRYKRMLTFPSVLIVYQVISFLILESTFLIGFTDREALFCSSQDWLEVLNSKRTPFCTFSGVVFYYTLWQAILWWLFHISAVFCGVKFPLRTRLFKDLGRMKYIHIGLVIAGILIPVIPVTAIASVAGFYNSFPPIFCFSTNTKAIFYSIIFPLCVLLASGISLMVGIVWIIIKGSCHFNNSERREGRTKAVTKLLILFSFFTLVLAVAFTVFTVNLKKGTLYYEALFKYFLCKQDPANMGCDRSSFQQYAYAIAPPNLATYILFNIYPITCLLYAVNITELRGKISVVCFKFKNKLSTVFTKNTAKQVSNQLQTPALELYAISDSAATCTLQTFASTDNID